MEGINICNCKHADKLFAYCYSESLYICEECYKQTHRTHRIDFVSLLAEDNLNACKKQIDDSTSLMQDFNNRLNSHSKTKLIEISKKNITEYSKKAATAITEYCETLIQQLPQYLHSQSINLERIAKSMQSGRDLLISIMGKLKQCKDQFNAHVASGNYKWFIEHIGTTQGATKIANGNVRVGIRPEFLSIAATGTGLPVKINRVEHRGGYKLVHADSEQGKFVAKLDNESALTAGQSVHLAFHPLRTYLFRDSKVCGTVNVKGKN